MLPIDREINVLFRKRVENGLECEFDNHIVMIPYDELSWTKDSTAFDHVTKGDRIKTRLFEYDYQNGCYLGSYRMTWNDNPYFELGRFPVESIFRGVIIEHTYSERDWRSETLVELTNGAKGTLSERSVALARSRLGKGVGVEVCIRNLLCTYRESNLLLIGNWEEREKTKSWPVFSKNNDTRHRWMESLNCKPRLNLGRCVLATVVQKEPYGLYYEYGNCRILVEIVSLTWGLDNACDFIQRSQLGNQHVVRLLGYDYGNDYYQGTLRNIGHIGPYWELTKNSPSAVYEGKIHAISHERTGEADKVYISLPNGAVGEIDLKGCQNKTYFKGDSIDVSIKKLTPLALSPYSSILEMIELP